MSKLTHSDLIKLGQLLGYKEFKNGLCHGFSMMLAQAVLAKSETIFFKRLKFIATYKNNFKQLQKKIEKAKKKAHFANAKLDRKTKELLEIVAFFDGIALYLRPANYKDLFKQYINPYELLTAYPLVKSKKLEGSRLKLVMNEPYIFDKDSLEAYLNDLVDLYQKNKGIVLPMLLTCHNHTVCLYYNSSNRRWYYVDTNDFERYKKLPTYFRALSSQKLATSLFESLSENCSYNIFSTTVLTTSNQNLQTINNAFTAINKKYPFKPEHVTYYNNEGVGLFSFACQIGNLTVVEDLLKKDNLNINQTRNDGVTPLYIACYHGYLNIVQALLRQNKLNINQARNNGTTPLYIACENGHHLIVRELLKHDEININKPSLEGISPLYIACFYNYLEIVKDLLKKAKLNVNQADQYGVTPLYIACEKGYREIAQELLKQSKLDINKSNLEGISPLYIACYHGHIEIIKDLLKHDELNINQADQYGVTPLYIACQNNKTEVVDLLLNLSTINVDSIGLDNFTPLQVACSSLDTKDNERLFELLVANHASLIHRNLKGQTALDIAFEKNNTAAITVLLNFAQSHNLVIEQVMSPSTQKQALLWSKTHCPPLMTYLKNKQYGMPITSKLTNFFSRSLPSNESKETTFLPELNT
ncbi:ankyrin repeat domain-containing protein [Legionella sp. D16C41]|uniref:ankyrin repeat domain-containing protein n=1 Tax=Legionella sp. D16C41 TaxID=3402688 RepID=UPI003AF4F811